MSEPLFDLDPPALVYPVDTLTPMHRMRCRECHQRRPINGGGGSTEYRYAVCVDCSADRGEVGSRARRAGFGGRELLVVEALGTPAERAS